MVRKYADQKLIYRSPTGARNMRAKVSISAREGLGTMMNCTNFKSKWLRSSWKKAKVQYLNTPCASENHFRIYCICIKGRAMC